MAKDLAIIVSTAVLVAGLGSTIFSALIRNQLRAILQAARDISSVMPRVQKLESEVEELRDAIRTDHDTLTELHTEHRVLCGRHQTAVMKEVTRCP